MTLEIGKRYHVKTPGGDEYIAIVNTVEEKVRHETNIMAGHIFTELKINAPQGGTCVSCEG